MDYSSILDQYLPAGGSTQYNTVVEKAQAKSRENFTNVVYKTCFSSLDLTSLSEKDNVKSISELARKASEMQRIFPDIPLPATICVYPSFVDVAGLGVEGTGIGVSSVAGGFPAGQTFLEVKMLEAAMAVENGADEIDIPINVGDMLCGDFDRAGNELEIIRNEIGDEVTFKVIIESGALATPDLIRKASLLAIYAGADFVKTSTGKSSLPTPLEAAVICTAIRDYYEKTGLRVGFKAAGGIRTNADAILYFTIVEEILGKEWLNPSLFRIGASSLANDLIKSITGQTTPYF